MRAFIVGLGSEIAKNLADRLALDGWSVHGCSREAPGLPDGPWDLLVLARGTLEPIGRFFDTGPEEWAEAIFINAVGPLRDLRALWPRRNPGAKVVFFGGPNMKKPNETYSAYRCGKAILGAILPTLNAEYPEHGFLMLHPGVVNTRFHLQTIAAGDRAANLARVERIVSGEEQTVSHADVYAKLKELIG